VSPGIASDTGFDSLNGIIAVERPEDLTSALEQAAAQAQAALRLPPAQRFPPGTPFWEAVGFRSWNEFVRGTTAVVVTRLDDSTLLQYDVPDPNHPTMLVATNSTCEYPPDVPLTEVARAALGLFAANPA
jgi:hypothetical protein